MGYEIPFLGLLLSLLFIALTGIYPGGIIVPSWLVLFIPEPARIVGPLVVALLAFGLYRLASRRLILFGRRRFVFLLLLGGVLAALTARLLPSVFPASLEFRVIGWVIPGLIANHFERQGPLVTTAGLVTVTVALALLGRVLGL